MVAEAFPEPRFVLLHQRNTPHPFGALPQIEMRHKKPCGAAVLRGEIFPVKSESDLCLLVPEILQGQICGVVPVGVRESIRGIGLDLC